MVGRFIYLFFEGHWEESGPTFLGELGKTFPPHFFLKQDNQGMAGEEPLFIYFSACPWGVVGTLSSFCDMGQRASLFYYSWLYLSPGSTCTISLFGSGSQGINTVKIGIATSPAFFSVSLYFSQVTFWPGRTIPFVVLPP